MSAAQTGFTNQLVKDVAKFAPNVNPALVVATGATELRDVFDKADIPGILQAYMSGLRVAYALAIAVAGIAVLVCALVPIKKLDTSKITGEAA